ncbi:MAG TPA: CHRD domain-containing protein [Rhizobacter sp.]|nr:CHRD domain-containing protein [Rhizobacter sp.]
MINKNYTQMLKGSLLAAAVVLSACAMSSPKTNSADFKATLSGSAEVPPNGSPGKGTLEAKLDKDTKVLSWTLTYSDLTGPATAAHFHGPAMPGENAGVVVPFASAASPIKGQTTLTDAQMADLLAGRWYANVHTAANKGGEIRGQVTTGM